MPGRREPQNARIGIVDGVDDRGERRIETVARKAVESSERGRRLQALEGDRAQRVPKLPHRSGRLHAFTDDVADHEPEPAIGELDRIEPVPADLDVQRPGEVASGDLDAREPRERDRQHAALQRCGDRSLRFVVACAIEGLRALARERLQEPTVVRLDCARLVPRELESTDGSPSGDERHDDEAP